MTTVARTVTPNKTPSSKSHYKWVIVAVCALMLAITYGLMYSYSVFFKPLGDYFHWDRATVSLVYSASLVIRGAIAIGTGWLADKYGARKVMLICGLMLGLGLILSSQVQNLWEFFLTYAVLLSVGLSGAFGIGTAIVARWFMKNRGLALGIVSMGSGVGTLFLVPGNERLISAFGWSSAFIILGSTAGVLMMAVALLLRPAPPAAAASNKVEASGKNSAAIKEPTVWQAVKDVRLLLLMGAFLMFFFSIQIIMVHLVNYATDLGIAPLMAATFISIISLASIGGRFFMGVSAERIDIHYTLLLTRVLLIVAFICILFTRTVWSFYLFAVLFGVPYGGEIPQIPLFIGNYFGTKSMATLVGISSFVMNVGGALGSWAAGKIFDSTRSYNGAFLAGLATASVSLILIVILKKRNRPAT